jgi:hypothetical protein
MAEDKRASGVLVDIIYENRTIYHVMEVGYDSKGHLCFSKNGIVHQCPGLVPFLWNSLITRFHEGKFPPELGDPHKARYRGEAEAIVFRRKVQSEG